MLKDFAQEEFDIFIQAGQSNGEGFGVGPVEDAYWQDERVWYLTKDFVCTIAGESILANEVQGNFSLSFVRKYIEQDFLKEGRKILIIRASEGSTGFLAGHWTENGDCYTRMMEMCKTALALNPKNRLKGLLWHQGETDASLNASFDTHYAHISGLVHGVRQAFNEPNLPFIAGDFVHHWKNENLAMCIPVIDAIQMFCKQDSYAAFVHTENLKSNYQEMGRNTQCGKEIIEDKIHFSRNSLYLLGERYFEAYKQL